MKKINQQEKEMVDSKKTDDNLAQTIGIDEISSRKNSLKRWWFLFVLLMVVVITIIAWMKKGNTSQIEYRTQQVKRGDITVLVTATGTLEPTNEVEVGSEQSGIIESIEADYNDKVKVGQILAKLDTSKLEAELTQSKASLESANAQVLQANATLRETKNKMEQYERVRELSDNKVPSQIEYNSAKASLERAKADLASAEAVVSQAQATLEARETDLAKAVIRSPINGIVLTRNIEPGQTVAASFETPVLFTIAEDLTMMELHVDVDEADIGKIKEEQDAIFTVDAYPDRTFNAKIIRTRFGAQTVEGVVTYETVLKVDNTDMSLRPGMTATADIIVMKVDDALLVPGSALRFKMPTPDEGKRQGRGGVIGKLLPGPPRRGRGQKQNENMISTSNKQQVWILEEDRPIMIPVTTGVTDGVMTEILDGRIESGMSLIVDILNKGK
jgi:HlyD family secretion protein